MKPSSIAAWVLCSLLGFRGAASAQENIQEALRQAIHKSLEDAGKGFGEKISEAVGAVMKEALARREARIAELEKGLAAKEKELTELRRELASAQKAAPAASKAFLGVGHIAPVEALRTQLKLEPGAGAQVTSVVAGSPAAQAGIKEGDVIAAIGDHPISSETLQAAVRHYQPGQGLKLTVLRGAEKLALEAKLVDADAFLAALKAAPAPKEEPKPEPAAPKKPVLGVLVEEKDGRLEVQNVEAGFTGEAAKLAPGDVIAEVNGQAVKTLEEMRAALDKAEAGKELSLKVRRKDEDLAIKVIAAADKGQAKLVEIQSAKVAAATPAPETKKPEEKKPERQPAHLGIAVEEGANGLKVLTVAEGSASAAAGIQPNDIVREVNKSAVKSLDELKKAIEGKLSGDKLDVVLERGGQKVEILGMVLAAKGETLAATAPKEPEKARGRGYLGLVAQENDTEVRVAEILKDGPAAKAGLQKDDVLLKLQGQPVKTFDDMVKALEKALEGDAIAIVLRRGDKEQELKVTLGKQP